MRWQTALPGRRPGGPGTSAVGPARHCRQGAAPAPALGVPRLFSPGFGAGKEEEGVRWSHIQMTKRLPGARPSDRASLLGLCAPREVRARSRPGRRQRREVRPSRGRPRGQHPPVWWGPFSPPGLATIHSRPAGCLCLLGPRGPRSQRLGVSHPGRRPPSEGWSAAERHAPARLPGSASSLRGSSEGPGRGWLLLSPGPPPRSGFDRKVTAPRTGTGTGALRAQGRGSAHSAGRRRSCAWKSPPIKCLPRPPKPGCTAWPALTSGLYRR